MLWILLVSICDFDLRDCAFDVVLNLSVDWFTVVYFLWISARVCVLVAYLAGSDLLHVFWFLTFRQLFCFVVCRLLVLVFWVLISFRFWIDLFWVLACFAWSV